MTRVPLQPDDLVPRSDLPLCRKSSAQIKDGVKVLVTGYQTRAGGKDEGVPLYNKCLANITNLQMIDQEYKRPCNIGNLSSFSNWRSKINE